MAHELLLATNPHVVTFDDIRDMRLPHEDSELSTSQKGSRSRIGRCLTASAMGIDPNHLVREDKLCIGVTLDAVILIAEAIKTRDRLNTSNNPVHIKGLSLKSMPLLEAIIEERQAAIDQFSQIPQPLA